MCDSPLKKLFSVGKYSLNYANSMFVFQGIYLWNGKNNIRIIPFNKFFEKDED